jgi:predicted CXXCH cytochrome family protein
MKINLFTMLSIIILATTLSFSQEYYLGVGNGTQTQGYSCSSCHTAGNIGEPVYDTWKFTLHAQAYDSLKNELNYSCLQCHTTQDSSLVNYGANEYLVKDTTKKLGYSITDTAHFNNVKNIQCETCHGPMGTSSRVLDDVYHFSTTTNKPNYSASLCGGCHSGHSPYFEQWSLSVHAKSTSGACSITPTMKSCTKCHVAQNFVAYASNPAAYKDTILVTGADVQPLTCVACHDPHDAKYPGQLRFDISQPQIICDQCHYENIDSVNINTTPHETTGPCLSGDPLFGYRYPGQTYINSAHTYAATERCVNCHVNMTPNADGGVNTGHTFEPRVQACAGCHSDYYSSVDTSNHAKMFDYRGTQTTTDSLINILQTKLNSMTHADSLTNLFKEANYNLAAINGEGSLGIHNTRLVQKLLKDAIASFSLTAIKNGTLLPAKFELCQNYPNPFNPTTTIRFSLPQGGNVRITIYDVTGKQIQTLINSYYAAGTFNVNWNAISFASGVYFYRIESGAYNMVKKMILLK